MSPISNRDPRPPQDSTIFIASLPSHIDQQELAGRLRNHFSQFAQIHNINVVRDNNGAACAFVQCHSSVEAARLIKSVRETEFFGRTLRAEPARALRTLLVSYCTPKHDFHSHQTTWDLPTSIKLSKSKTSKFYVITYNEQPSLSAQDELFVSPPLFNREELERLASFFGPLEEFRTLDRHPPYPHGAQRSPNMDPQCYEIKWAYREDCVAALTTLKRIPHLTVTWSHQQRRAHHNNLPRPALAIVSPWNESDFPPLASNGGMKPIRGVWDRPLSKPEVAQAELSMSSDMSLETISSATNTEEATTAGQAVDHVTVHTPSLVTSPITPVTPPNEQLVTPIDPPHINFSRLSLSKSDNYFSNPSEIPSTNSPTASSSIDPLSIFIGGLNVQGNAAWNEEKVAEHFGNFGTIQNVRFLHPPGQRTAFAFVTYSDAESAIRAVQKEHNQAYYNRTIRVQLREINPSRSPWKFQRNKGRADYRSPSNSPSKESPIVSFCEAISTPLNSSVRGTEPSSPPLSAADTSHFREWYEIEPTPTLPTSTMPLPPVIYPGNGYPLPPWMHFPGQFQYPMGFYPGYTQVPITHPSLYHPAAISMDNTLMPSSGQTSVGWVHYPGLVHSPPLSMPNGSDPYTPQYLAETASLGTNATVLSQPSPAPSSDCSSSAAPQHPPMPMNWHNFKQMPLPSHAPTPWMNQPLAPPFHGPLAGEGGQSNQAPPNRGDVYTRRRLSAQHVSGTRGRGRVHVYGPNRTSALGRGSVYDPHNNNEVQWVSGN